MVSRPELPEAYLPALDPGLCRWWPLGCIFPGIQALHWVRPKVLTVKASGFGLLLSLRVYRSAPDVQDFGG